MPPTRVSQRWAMIHEISDDGSVDVLGWRRRYVVDGSHEYVFFTMLQDGRGWSQGEMQAWRGVYVTF